MSASIDVLRRIHPEHPDLAWGIVTGTSPQRLSLVAAKAVLGSATRPPYRDAASAVVTTRGPAGTLSVIGGPDPYEPTIAGLTARPWNTLVFAGHGRGYCACQGFLCAARTDAEPPDLTAGSCVLGHDCIDARFPQVDPRSTSAEQAPLLPCQASATHGPNRTVRAGSSAMP